MDPTSLRLRVLAGRMFAAWFCPARCLLCPAAPGRGGLCAACRGRLAPAFGVGTCERCTGPLPCRDCALFRGPLERILAPFRFAGAGGELVKRGKFEADFAALGLLAGAMRRRLQAARGLGAGTVLVPVPLALERRLRRGFNQARVLADFVGARLGLRVSSGALRRRRRTRPQGRLETAARAANLSGAFALGPAARLGALHGRTVVLVDDVVTSGATLRSCGELLGRAGARRVLALCACSARAAAGALSATPP